MRGPGILPFRRRGRQGTAPGPVPPRPAGEFARGLEEANARELARVAAILDGEDERSVTDVIAAEPEREFPGPSRVLAEPKADAERHAPGERPYADIAASQVAAYRFAAASEGTGPQPEYHPVAGAAPVTAPLPVLLAGNAKVPPPPPPAVAARHVRPPAAEVPDLAVLRDVRAGLLKRWQAERAVEFSADRRQLPLFAAVTREFGWTGLHVPVRSTREFRHQRWTVERWHRQADAATAAQTAAARAEARTGLAEGGAR